MNVKQAVPFFMVSNIETSLRWYIGGLGFTMTNQWIVDGRIRWCLLEHGTAGLMLQVSESEKGGAGVSICFLCEDALALYHDFRARGVDAAEPFVGNGLWVTSVRDPDGYRLDFESPTDVPEDTTLSEYKGS